VARYPLRPVEDQQRDAFGRVTWCLQNLDADIPQFEEVALFHSLDIELRLSTGSHHDAGTGAVSQFDVPREKVRMKVREHHVLDRVAAFLSVAKVLFDVPLRINNDRLLGPFIGD
jgi:hypothetical protein